MAERIEGFICSNTLGEFVDRLSKEVCGGRAENSICILKHKCVPVAIEIGVGKERLFTAAEVEEFLHETASELRREALGVRRGQITEYRCIGTDEEASRLLESSANAFDFVADHAKFRLKMYGGQKDLATILAVETQKTKEKDQAAATA